METQNYKTSTLPPVLKEVSKTENWRTEETTFQLFSLFLYGFTSLKASYVSILLIFISLSNVIYNFVFIL